MVDSHTEESVRRFMADRIKIAMDECPLKGERFAEAVGVSKAAASKWSKTGHISHYRLLRMAEVTKRPIGWFYPGFERPEIEGSLSELLSSTNDPVFLEEALLEVLEARKRASRRQ